MELNLSQVQNLVTHRRFSEAKKICTPFIDKGSKSDQTNALHLYGTCLFLEGNVGNAIGYFKKVLEIDPKHTDAAISLSIIYNDIGKYSEAKQIYNLANQSLQLKKQGIDEHLDNRFAIKHIELGDLYFKYHRFDEALDDYSKAIQLDSSLLDVRIKIAKVYAKKGFTTRAIQELQQLTREHEDFVPARIQLGLMHFSLGNVIDAKMEWERAQSQAPQNSEIRTYLDMANQASETSV